MKVYFYSAKTEEGELKEGTLQAVTLEAAAHQVMSADLFLLKLSETTGQNSKPGGIFNFNVITRRDIIAFTRQLAGLTGCHVAVVQGLKMMAKRCRNRALEHLILDINEKVADGQPLSSSLAKYPKYFSLTYIHMVKAAELSGQLGPVLTRVADMLLDNEQRKAQVRSAMYYPLFVFVLGIVMVTVMLTFVVPRLSGLFTEFGARLPWPTIILMHVSNFFAAYGILVVVLMAVVVYVLQAWTRSPDGKKRMDMFFLRAPFYGDWVVQIESAKIFKTLAMLLDNDVSMVPSLTAACDVTDNVILKEELSHILKKVKEGQALARSMEQSRWFDDMFSEAIATGEVTGNLVQGLNQVVHIYEQEAANRGQVFLSLLGPVFLVVIIGIVGFVVMALLMPIMEANFLMGG